MALNEIAVKSKGDDKESTERFVGMKLENQDADDLASLYGLPAGTGGSTIFRAMVKDKLIQAGLLKA